MRYYLGFWMMAVLLLLGACNKEVDRDHDVDPQDTTPVVLCPSVTFGDYTWQQILGEGHASRSDNYTGVILWEDSSAYYPRIYAFWSESDTGTYTDWYLDRGNYTFGIAQMMEYYESQQMVDADGNYYGDWWADTVRIQVVEQTAEYVVVTIDAVMFSAVDAYYYGTGVAGAARKPMQIKDLKMNTQAAKHLYRCAQVANSPVRHRQLRAWECEAKQFTVAHD